MSLSFQQRDVLFLENLILFSFHLQNMPVNDRSSGVFNHFFPVFQLKALAIVAKQNFPDRV